MFHGISHTIKINRKMTMKIFNKYDLEKISNENLLIVGCGGHSKVVFDIAQYYGFKNIKFFNEKKNNLDDFFKNKIIMNIKKNYFGYFIVAIGDNFIREKVYHKFLEDYKSAKPINLIHPNSVISKSCNLGLGNVIMSNVVLNSSVKLGNGIIINTSSTVDHDSKLENFSSLAPGVNIGGNVTVGERTSILIGASIKHNIKIGDDSVVGGSSFVNRDIGKNKLAYGIPAKIVRERLSDEKYL